MDRDCDFVSYKGRDVNLRLLKSKIKSKFENKKYREYWERFFEILMALRYRQGMERIKDETDRVIESGLEWFEKNNFKI